MLEGKLEVIKTDWDRLIAENEAVYKVEKQTCQGLQEAIEELDRNKRILGNEYPQFKRSLEFEMEIEGIKLKSYEIQHESLLVMKKIAGIAQDSKMIYKEESEETKKCICKLDECVKGMEKLMKIMKKVESEYYAPELNSGELVN